MHQGHGLGTLRFPDDPWGRLPWLTAAAVVLTSACLMGFLRLIEEPLTTIPLPPPVSVEVIEVVAASPTTASPVTPREMQPLPAPPRRAEPSKPPQDSPRAAPTRQPAPDEPPAAPLAPQPPVETAGPQLARPAPQPSAPSAPAAPRSELPAPGPSREGGGRMGARALYQPLPELPDDLRRRSIEAVAVARFRVAEDGSAQVQLVEPTSDPDLNRALLDTLRRWRFFPAMQDGKPVASSVDIRIPVSVK